MATRASGCIVALLLAGCASGPPPCDDVEVTDLALSIAKDVVVQQAFLTNLREATGAFPASIIGSVPVSTWKTNPPKPEELTNRFSFTVEQVHEVIRKTEGQLEQTGMHITAVRVDDINEKTGKAFCGANLTLGNGKSWPISYTAQYTEDGQMYVEITDG